MAAQKEAKLTARDMRLTWTMMPLGLGSSEKRTPAKNSTALLSCRELFDDAEKTPAIDDTF